MYMEIFLCHKYKLLTHITLGNTVIEDKTMTRDNV